MRGDGSDRRVAKGLETLVARPVTSSPSSPSVTLPRGIIPACFPPDSAIFSDDFPPAPPLRHDRAAVRQWAVPHRPHHGIHPGRYLGAVPAHAGQQGAFHRRGRCARRADHAQGRGEGVTPDELVARIAADRPKYLEGFHISFDNWHSTHSPENTELSQEIYRTLQTAGLIYVKPVEQFFDPVKNMFLADRYVKGECPNCHAKDQYGDACEVCSSVYEPTDLINPYSTLSGADAGSQDVRSLLCQALRSEMRRVHARAGSVHAGPSAVCGHQQGERVARRQGRSPLSDKDISRDAPYFGIPIPDAPGKYFYVWLDAPIGYLASLKKYFDSGKARANGEIRSFDEFLAAPDVEQIHFIGKDIIYFHTLFWPAMLQVCGAEGAGQRLRARLHHRLGREDVEVARHRHQSAALSRSRHESGMAALLHRGQAERAMSRTSTSIRKTSSRASTATWSASTSISRAAWRRFVAKFFDNRMPAFLGQVGRPAARRSRQSDADSRGFEEREFGRAIRVTMDVADMVNAEIDSYKPWILAKDAATMRTAGRSCRDLRDRRWRHSRLLTLFLKPILPDAGGRRQRRI